MRSTSRSSFGVLAFVLLSSIGRAQMASPLEVRLGGIELGPHADVIRALVRAARPAPRAASLEVVQGPGAITLVAWDTTKSARPGRTDLRTMWLVAQEGSREVTRDIHPIGVAPDGQSADLIREEGTLSLRGYSRATVGVVRVGAEDRLIYRVVDGALAAGWAPTTGELRNTVCGVALVNGITPTLLDLASLKVAAPTPCRHGLANLLRAGVDADPVVRDAEAALDALAPYRHYKAPTEKAPGMAACARPTIEQKKATHAQLEAFDTAPPGGALPDKVFVTRDDFGCVDSRDGSFLVRVLGTGKTSRMDAVFSMRDGTLRRVFGYEAAVSHEIHAWLEIDLDSDGVCETLVLRAFPAPRGLEWQMFRSSGDSLLKVPEPWRGAPRIRPISNPAGSGLLIDRELLALRKGQLVAVKDGFPTVRAALQAVDLAKRTLELHRQALALELWSDVAGADGKPLARSHPGRVAWEQAVRSRLVVLGAAAAKLEPFFAFAP